MKTSETNNTVIEGYIELLSNLSQSNKLALISKLSELVEIDSTQKKSSFKKAYGALDTEKTAEEIITDIRNSRVSTRKIETF